MIPELNLLRLLVGRDGAAIRVALTDPAADLTAWLRFAHAHQLATFSYSTLKQLGLSSLLAPRLLAGIKAASMLERDTGEKLQAMLRELADLFDRCGVGVLFIKGPLFAQRFYGSVEPRAVADLDILVRSPRDVEAVEAALLGAGFDPAFHVPASRRLSRYFAHHFEYRRDSLPLDVHWALQSHFTFAIDYDRIWATSLDVEFAGRTYRSTSDEYELVLQIIGVVTDVEVGKLALRSLVDIVQVLTRLEGRIDWSAFFAQRRRERILRPSIYILRLALDVLDCHGRFPHLDRTLKSMHPALPPTSRAFDAVLRSRPMDFRQKLLALRIYEAPLLASLAWWLVSLPFRVLAFGIRRRTAQL
jgi:hypothetical protein